MTTIASTIPGTMSAVSKAGASSWMPSFLDNIKFWQSPKKTTPPVTQTVATMPPTKSLVTKSDFPSTKVFDSSATDAEAAKRGSSSSGRVKGKKNFRHGRPWDAYRNGITSLFRYDQSDWTQSAPNYSELYKTLGTIDSKTGLRNCLNRIMRHGLTEHNVDNMSGNNSRHRTRKIAGITQELDMKTDHALYSMQTSLSEKGKKLAQSASSWYPNESLGKRLVVLSDYYRTRETARDVLGLPTEEEGTIKGLSEEPEIWTLANGNKLAVVRSKLFRECSMQCSDKKASECASMLTELATKAGYTGVDFVLHGNLNHTLAKGAESQARNAQRKYLEGDGIPEGFEDLSEYAHGGDKYVRSLFNNLETQHVGFRSDIESERVARTDPEREAVKMFNKVEKMMKDEEEATIDNNPGYGRIVSLTMVPTKDTPDIAKNYVYSTAGSPTAA